MARFRRYPEFASLYLKIGLNVITDSNPQHFPSPTKLRCSLFENRIPFPKDYDSCIFRQHHLDNSSQRSADGPGCCSIDSRGLAVLGLGVYGRRSGRTFGS